MRDEKTPNAAPIGYFTKMKPAFKGNKSSLPSKLCTVCGRPMTWRKAWAKNWAEVKFCSEKCRRHKVLENA